MAEAPHRSPSRSDRRRVPPPAAVLVPLAALLGWRVLAAPGDRLIGHVMSEHTSHLWVQWLLERAMFEGADWLGQEGVLTVGRLWLMPNDPLLRLITGLLQPVLGVVAATNLVILGVLALAAVAVAELAREAGAGRVPATLGGLVLLLHPALLGFAADGRMDSLGVGWIALLGITWLRGWRAPSWRRGLWMGLAAVAVVGAGPNHVVTAALLFGLPSLVALVLRPAFLRVLLPGALAAGLAVGLMGSVLLHIESQQSSRLQETVTHDTAQVGGLIVETTWERVGQQRQADGWVATRRLHEEAPTGSIWELPAVVSDRVSLQGPLREQMVLQTYSPGAWTWPGIVPWLLGLAGLLRRPRQVAPWLGVAAGLFVLSFGWGSAQSLPLSVAGRLFYFAPASLLGRLPGLSAFNNYGLFGVLAAGSLGVAVALGWTGARWQRWVCGLAALAWVAEVQHSPVPLPLPASDVQPPEGLVEALAELPEDLGVLVLPIHRGTNTLLQIHHGRPTPQRFWAGTGQGQGGHPMLEDLGNAQWRLIRSMLPREHTRARLPDGALAESGIGGILLLHQLLPTELQAAADDGLSAAMDVEPIWEAELGVLYAVPAAMRTPVR